MADTVYYNKEQVDKMLKDAKAELTKEVDEIVSVGSKQASKPSFANQTLSFTILKSETK